MEIPSRQHPPPPPPAVLAISCLSFWSALVGGIDPIWLISIVLTSGNEYLTSSIGVLEEDLLIRTDVHGLLFFIYLVALTNSPSLKAFCWFWLSISYLLMVAKSSSGQTSGFLLSYEQPTEVKGLSPSNTNVWLIREFQINHVIIFLGLKLR